MECHPAGTKRDRFFRLWTLTLSERAFLSFYFQTRLAVSTTSRSLAHCSSSVNRFPSMVEANPHCGLSARLSIGKYRPACSILRTRSSPFSSCGSFELTSPSTTVLFLGMKRRGSNVPERSSSYSRRKRSAAIVVNNFSAIASYPPSAYQWLRLFPRQRCTASVTPERRAASKQALSALMESSSSVSGSTFISVRIHSRHLGSR